MTGPLLAFALLGAIVATSIGAARIMYWLLGGRDRAATQHAKEAALVAQARAELAATGWTPDEETLYQAEIATSKRGDLLAAARYAEQRETAHV